MPIDMWKCAVDREASAGQAYQHADPLPTPQCPVLLLGSTLHVGSILMMIRKAPSINHTKWRRGFLNHYGNNGIHQCFLLWKGKYQGSWHSELQYFRTLKTRAFSIFSSRIHFSHQYFSGLRRRKHLQSWDSERLEEFRSQEGILQTAVI